MSSRSISTPFIRTQTRLRTHTLAEQVDAHPGAFLALFSLIYWIAVIYAASKKPFWSDEIFTIWIAEFPHIGDIWTAFHLGLEDSPLPPFWIAWILYHLGGAGHILMRLPAMFGFWVMSLCLYLFVRRRATPAYGFIALVIPLFTFATRYSVEARGYGLMLASSGIALLSWQRAAEATRRNVALVGLALGIAGAVSCHYYATYLAGALLVGEVMRAHTQRRLDWPCFAAILCGVTPLIAYWPLIAAVLPGAKTFWMLASVRGVLWSYFQMLTPAFVLGFPLLIWVLLRDPHAKPSREHTAFGLRPWEVVTAAVLVAMPVVILFAGQIFPLALWDKYVLLSVVGLAILLPAAVQHWTNNSPAAADLVLKTALFFCFVPWAIFRVYGLYLQPAPADLVREQTLEQLTSIPRTRTLPIVTTDEVPFVQEFFYAPPDRKDQICVLIDPLAAAKFQGDNNAQNGLIGFRRWRHVPAYDYGQFLADHPEFILVRPDGPDWLTPKLLSDGATLTLIDHREQPGRFQPKTEIFLVRTAAQARAPSTLP